MIPALTERIDLRYFAGAMVFLLLAFCSSGCGSSDRSATAAAQQTAKGEGRIRYEGTGKNKQEILIRRRDERIKKLQEAAKEKG